MLRRVQHPVDRLRPRFRIVTDTLPELEEFFGLLRVGRSELLHEQVVESLRSLCRTRLQCLPAPHTETLLPRRILSTTRTLDRRNLVALRLFDLTTVHARELSVSLLGEHGDVAGGRVAPANPAVVVLQMRLIHPLRRKVSRRGLSEVRNRHRLRHARAFGRRRQHLRHHLVGQLVPTGEATPQRRVTVITTRMLAQPRGHVRDGWNQRHCSLSALPVDGDLKAMLVVRNVADSNPLKLAATRPSVERERDSRRVTRVPRSVEHVLDVGTPAQHVARLRRRVVVRRVRRRDPRQRLRDARVIGLDVAIGEFTAKDSERNSVVSVRLLVVVGSVNPTDEVFGDIAVSECVSDAAEIVLHSRFFGSNEVSEKLPVAAGGEVAGLEVQSIRELKELVTSGEFPRAVTQRFNLMFDIHTTKCSRLEYKCVGLNLRVKTLPGHQPKTSEPYFSQHQPTVGAGAAQPEVVAA